MLPPLLMGVIVFTDRLPHLLPTGVLAFTVGWSQHRCWASTSSPTGHLVTVDWCFRLHYWPPYLLSASTTTRLCYPYLGNFVFTIGFASVVAASCSHHHEYATLSPLWGDFIFIVFGTGKLYCFYFASFATSLTTLSPSASTSRCAPPCYDVVLFYYNKWCSNFEDFHSNILNTHLHSSNDYSANKKI